MTFAEQLNKYLKSFGMTQKALSELSGLSRASISRYCSGEREPSAGSEQLTRLASGLCRTTGSVSYDECLTVLTDTLSENTVIDYEVFISKLRSLMKQLNMRPSELARGLYMDPSHISRILSGSRRPRNIGLFISNVSAFITQRYTGLPAFYSIAEMLGLDEVESNSPALLREHLASWLGSSEPAQEDGYLPKLLTEMDEFDIYAHLSAEKSGKVPLPTSIPRIQARRKYEGMEEMKNGELDFLRATVLSESMDPCILYNEMPLDNMMKDLAFRQKYFNGIKAVLKKGLHIDFIHNVNRPIREVMVGLENYLPMYMTGQITPYYLPAAQEGIFNHLLKVSGAAALEGASIAGNQKSGRYVLYNTKSDLRYYHDLAEKLLAQAQPLLEIFSRENGPDFADLMSKHWEAGHRKTVCSSLPVYLADKELIEEIVQNSHLSEDLKEIIMRYYSESRQALTHLLEKNRVHFDIPKIDESAFTESPLSLALADIFIEKPLTLTYDMYQRYLDGVIRLSANNDNLFIGFDTSPALRNINYTIIKGRLVIVSKEKGPAIHFVISHKRLVRAFVNYIPRVVK